MRANHLSPSAGRLRVAQSSGRFTRTRRDLCFFWRYLGFVDFPGRARLGQSCRNRNATAELSAVYANRRVKPVFQTPSLTRR